MSTITGCNQWLSLAERTLKVAHASKNRSLLAHTSKCGWAMNLFIFIFETECRQSNVEGREVVEHTATFMSSKEEISQPGIEPPTSSLRFGYLSTIIQQFKIVSDQVGYESNRQELENIKKGTKL